MGFNTVLTIRNEDLPLIAQDPDFGQSIYAAVTYGDRIIRERGRGNAVRLSEFESVTGRKLAYEVHASESHHASTTGIHVVQDGGMATLGYAQHPSWSFIEAAAAAFNEHGYRIENKACKFLSEACDVTDLDPLAAERAWMGGYEQNVFDQGATTFLVLNDALSCIRDQADLGQRFAKGISDFWTGRKYISDRNLANPDTPHVATDLSDNIGAGNHFNPIQIISITPKGQADLIATGGNWGRELRPHLPLLILNRMVDGSEEHLVDIRQSDIQQVKQSFLEMGFHVRTPGRTRAESPAAWAEKHWLQLEEPSDTPEP